MTTIRAILGISALLLLSSCSSWEEAKAKRAERESYANPFYVKYLEPGSELDRAIMARIEALRVNPGSPALHNELGALLFERRFPKDARYEFERAIKIDKRFYPARYNLALLELAEGNSGRATRQLKKVVGQKPGHPEAHFTLGLIYEQRGQGSAAIDHYARAYTINPELLQVSKNPRIVDSRLVTASLLTMYDASLARGAVRFVGAPGDYVEPVLPETKASDSAPEPQPVEQAMPVAEPNPVPPAPGR